MQFPLHRWILKNNINYLLKWSILLIGSIAIFTGCGKIFGDIGSVKEAEELAVECRTDEALYALETSSQGGGLSAGLGDLMRVVFLRDVGRNAEADIAMKQRNERWNADEENIAESEEAVAESVEKIRDEREERTGSRLCN